MKKTINFLLLSVMAIMMTGCMQQQESATTSPDAAIQQLAELYPNADKELMTKGVTQAASLWQATDGTQAEFNEFVAKHYVADAAERRVLFDKLAKIYEVLLGASNQVSVELNLPTMLAGPEPTDIDYMMSAFNPFSHLTSDLFDKKVAFITIINFPHFSLDEKNNLGASWSREQWAYARMGDMFTSRVPAEVNQSVLQAQADAENYIAGYNIMMGHLLNEEGEKLFPEDMVLLTHWNLRDEIKSNYADVPNAHEKQEMVYRVLQHIIEGTIPMDVINNASYDWAPYSNKTWKDGAEVTLAAEDTRRYERILAHFNAMKMVDKHEPQSPTGIIRNFEVSVEMSASEIEELFINLISSNQVKAVSNIIKERLGRDLRPYDIWYDGFKSRSAISEDDLTKLTRAKYPTPEAFEADMPRMLQALGFDAADATYIADKITVQGARGSGHAWGAVGRWENSLLRTRIGQEGMDYKGYNIAVHEFGHNVEQTIDLYDIDHYTLRGVPNTGFTEALAFVFQKRDLQLLGFDTKIDDNTTLDIFWGLYEIMGVSLVDMRMWQWLYANPDATAAQLRDTTIAIAKEVWNSFYMPVLGEENSPILACYSHMVNSPMYLPNYPLGHIIEFQLEEHFAQYNNKSDFAKEMRRIYELGRLTPNQWMQQAVGSNVSTTPILNAVDVILKK